MALWKQPTAYINVVTPDQQAPDFDCSSWMRALRSLLIYSDLMSEGRVGVGPWGVTYVQSP
jgi:hypothetical protein